MKSLLILSFLSIAALGYGRDVVLSPAACQGKSAAGRTADYMVGNIDQGKLKVRPEILTLSFEEDALAAANGEYLETVEFGAPMQLKVKFDGFMVKKSAEAAYSLAATGIDRKCSASISFSKPVAAAGFTLAFVAGTVTVKFIDENGDALQNNVQNGQPSPKGEGWATYYFAYKTPDDRARITKIEFTRSNIKSCTANAGFSIDDFSFMVGRDPLKVTLPSYKESDLRRIAGAKAADVSPYADRGEKGSIVRENGNVVFRCHNQVEYRLTPSAGPGSLQGRLGQGAWQALGTGMAINYDKAAPGKLVRDELSGNGYTAIYSFGAGKETWEVRCLFRMVGGTLRLELSSSHAGAVTITPPKLEESLDLTKEVIFLGFANVISYLPQTQSFYSYLVDWTKSNSSMPEPVIKYQANLAGKFSPLHEVVTFTLADNIDAILPSIPNPTSSYRQLIANSMVVEWWYGSFEQLGETLDMYHNYGMDDIIVLVHRWQRYGFDRKLPVILPADPNRGGQELLSREIRRATARGQRVALHENYVDMYPDSPSWNPQDLMLQVSGQPQAAWANSKHLSPSKIMKYAGKTMPEIKEQLGTNAAFLDVHSTHAPWWRTDFAAGVPYSGMMKGTWQFNNEMWKFARENYQGPVFGEGFVQSSWLHAGYIDSVMGQTKQNARLFADFLLLKVRPVAVNHGVGYFERWNTRNYTQPDWMTAPLTPEETDDYNASIVAYQTAATLDDKVKNNIAVAAREYYQIRAIVGKLVAQPVVKILYHDGTRWLSSSQAVLSARKDIRRIKTVFADGTVIHVNRSSKPWMLEDKQTVSPFGFLVQGKDVSAVSGLDAKGRIFDYYGDANAYYLDPRNYDWAMSPNSSIWFGHNNGEAPIRSNDGTATVAMGPLETQIAVSCLKGDNGWRLRFFPQKSCGLVKIKTGKLGGQITQAIPLDRDGKPLAENRDEVKLDNGELSIKRVDANVWSYQLR